MSAEDLRGGLQPLANMLLQALESMAGEPVNFVLLASIPSQASYIGNMLPDDAAALMRDALDKLVLQQPAANDTQH